jgi:uncharacterized DUF497 family protein
MNLVWDEDKSKKLKAERGISLEEVAEMILKKEYVDILKHPRRRGQWLFLVPIRGYVHVVPFVLDADGNLVLKTVYPSRKFHRRFGGKHS